MAIIPGKTQEEIVIDTPQKQRNRKLLLLLLGVIILTGGVIYFGFFSGSTSQPTDLVLPAARTSLSAKEIEEISQANKIIGALKDISLENQIFLDRTFKSLKINDLLPIVVGPVGRENPFEPF